MCLERANNALGFGEHCAWDAIDRPSCPTWPGWLALTWCRCQSAGLPAPALAVGAGVARPAARTENFEEPNAFLAHPGRPPAYAGCSVWFGLVRFGLVWFGLVRFGSVRVCSLPGHWGVLEVRLVLARPLLVTMVCREQVRRRSFAWIFVRSV